MPQQPPALPPTAGGWQNPQAASMYAGNEFSGGAQVQAPDGQTSSWDPRMQASIPSYVSAPGTFPSQAYSSRGTHIGPAPLQQGHHQPNV